jgi:hypothetical protein
MPGGYSDASLLPVSGGATSVPIMAMRGGGADLTGGSMLPLTSAAAIAPIEAMRGGAAAPAQKGVKFARENQTQTSEGTIGSQPSKAVLAGFAVTPAPAKDDDPSPEDLKELEDEIKREERAERKSQPDDISGNIGLRTLFGNANNNAYPSQQATDVSAIAIVNVQKEGLPFNIFGNEYHIRPPSERNEDAELTKEEQAVIKRWRADEYYTTRKQQNKFLNELVYGCRSDIIIPNDPNCGMVRKLLTNLASREWGAFHSSGKVKGLSGIDREKCEFVFDVEGACDMTKMLNEADVMDFFTKPSVIMDKSSYTYLDNAPAVATPTGVQPCTLTLQDLNDVIRMATIAGIGMAGSNEALKKRIRAYRDRLIHFIATMCETAKTEQGRIDDFLFGSGGGVTPAIFTGVEDKNFAGIRDHITALRAIIGDDGVRENVHRILHRAMDASGEKTGGDVVGTVYSGLRDLSGNVDKLNRITEIAGRSVQPLTPAEGLQVDAFCAELLQREDEFSRIVREVIEHPQARAVWNHLMSTGMHSYRAFREAHNLIFYRLGMPGAPSPGSGSGSGPGSGTASPDQLAKLQRDTRELIEFMRARRRLIAEGRLDKDGNPIAGAASAVAPSAGAGAVAAGAVAVAGLAGAEDNTGAGTGIGTPITTGAVAGGTPGASPAVAVAGAPGASPAVAVAGANAVEGADGTTGDVVALAGALPAPPGGDVVALAGALPAPPGGDVVALAGALPAPPGGDVVALAGALPAPPGAIALPVGPNIGARARNGARTRNGADTRNGAPAPPTPPPAPLATPNISTLSNEELCNIIAGANGAEASTQAQNEACARIRQAEEAEAKAKADAEVAGSGAEVTPATAPVILEEVPPIPSIAPINMIQTQRMNNTNVASRTNASGVQSGSSAIPEDAIITAPETPEVVSPFSRKRGKNQPEEADEIRIARGQLARHFNDTDKNANEIVNTLIRKIKGAQAANVRTLNTAEQITRFQNEIQSILREVTHRNEILGGIDLPPATDVTPAPATPLAPQPIENTDKDLCDDIEKANRATNSSPGAGAARPAPTSATVLGEEDIAKKQSDIQSALTSIESQTDDAIIIGGLKEILNNLSHLERNYDMTRNTQLSTYITEIRNKVLKIAKDSKNPLLKLRENGEKGRKGVTRQNVRPISNVIKQYTNIITGLETVAPSTTRAKLGRSPSNKAIGLPPISIRKRRGGSRKTRKLRKSK